MGWFDPIEAFLSAYSEWDAHVEIAVGAALASSVVVHPAVSLGVVRLLALPVAGGLLFTQFLVGGDEESFFEFVRTLSGLKQVLLASVPAVGLVAVTGLAFGDLLQLSYWLFGLGAVIAVCSFGVSRLRV